MSTWSKTLFLGTVATSLGVATAGSAQLLNSFEDPTTTNGDGDTVFPGAAPASFGDGGGSPTASAVAQVTGTGVTDGTFAAATSPLSAGFAIQFQLDLTPADAMALAAAGQFAIDVYGDVNNDPDNGFGIQLATLTEAGADLTPGTGDDFGNFNLVDDPIAGGNFFYVGDETQTTLTINLDADNISHFSSPGSVGILFVVVNNDTASRVTFDNARIVPEPASATLIGLGAVAMLCRRR